jgi:hypothetical protein
MRLGHETVTAVAARLSSPAAWRLTGNGSGRWALVSNPLFLYSQILEQELWTNLKLWIDLARC